MNVLTVSAHLKALYRFLTTNDPEYQSLETKIHIQLTRIVYRVFSILSCLVSLFANKSLANIAVILMVGNLIQLVMTEKTLTLMKIFVVVGTCGATFLRFFLIGPETAIFNQMQCTIVPFMILIWTNSIPLTAFAFLYTVVSTTMISSFMDQENTKSIVFLENSFLYLKQNYQVLNLLIFMLVFLLVCQKQALLASLCARQKEKEELLREIQIKNRELEELSKSKTRLILGLSHEFRNPINASLGNLELASERVADQAIRQYISNCKTSIELIFHLVSNLLDASKIEAGVLEQNLLYKKSSVIFQKVWDIAKNSLDKKKLIGEFYIHREIPQILNTDSHFMMKIMLNLILNAVKYTEEGGVMTALTWIDNKEFSETMLQPTEKFYSKFQDNFIRKKKSPYKNILMKIPILDLVRSPIKDDPSEVPREKSARTQFSHIEEDWKVNAPSIKSIESFQRATQFYEKLSNHQASKDLNISRNLTEKSKNQVQKKGFLKIEVYDSGCGIDSCIIQEVIFQKFSSMSLETGHRLGLGLGLWLTKNLCELMNGKLRAFSEKCKGSQFIAVLPLEAPDYIHLEDLKSYAGNPLTALVVDDDKFNREINTAFLSRAGINVEDEACNGQEAVEIFMSRPAYSFDFIVMDLEMPVMGGKEACQRIREYERIQKIRPTKIVIATGNCDQAEYRQCMKPDGDIRADLFYRKPLLNKDIEEMVEILQRDKASQYTCFAVGIGDVVNEILRKFLRKHRAQHISVESAKEALKILNEYQIKVKWILVHLNLDYQDLKELMNTITRLSVQSSGIEIIILNEIQQINKASFYRDLGLTKFLNFPFSNYDLKKIFGYLD